MTINLPITVENSLRDAVGQGQFASMDEAMTEAALLLLRRLGSASSGPDAQETAYVILEKAGLLGCLPGEVDSPTDLSTNPAHMDGFGRA